MMKIISFYFLVVILAFPMISFAQNCTVNIPEFTSIDDFVFYKNGTVNQKSTGLMWKRCLEGQVFSNNDTDNEFSDDKCLGEPSLFNWQEALTLVTSINSNGLLGYKDWRIPNIKELISLIEDCRVSPGSHSKRNIDIFPISLCYEEWSSTSNASYPTYTAWGSSSCTDYESTYYKNISISVRLVRN